MNSVGLVCSVCVHSDLIVYLICLWNKVNYNVEKRYAYSDHIVAIEKNLSLIRSLFENSRCWVGFKSFVQLLWNVAIFCYYNGKKNKNASLIIIFFFFYFFVILWFRVASSEHSNWHRPRLFIYTVYVYFVGTVY